MQHAAMLTAMLCLGQAGPDDDAFFEAKIRPVLSESCFRCHGGTKVSNDLRVDSREALVKGGKRGPALVPGQPDKSLLLQAMQHSRQGPAACRPARKCRITSWRTSPPGSNAALPGPKTWPKSGFAEQKHWAFQPRQRMCRSRPIRRARTSTPSTASSLAKLRQEGLAPVGPAEPPDSAAPRQLRPDRSAAQSQNWPSRFCKDTSADAFARVVDRLLASPQYGERWGRHWMDVVRYADTAGDNADYPIPEIHRYRDYIIDAFNADKPFDQFVQEQLAGDILARQGPPQKFAERVVATGFLALSRRYATGPYEFWHLSLEDCIDTTGAAFLGLTMRCARCHDHKFDPISKEDYYGLYGIFASTVFPFAGAEEFASMNAHRRHFVPLLPNADEVMAGYRQRLMDLEARIKMMEKAQSEAKDKAGKDNLTGLRNELKMLQKLGLPADVPGAYAVQDGKPVEVRVHLQGDPEKLGAVAPRRVPKFLEGSPVDFPADGSGRLQLAQWLTRAEHPLTARVLVNRVWQYHFGQGLVGTPNNFGFRGEPSTHPELLDHLAGEFVRHGWSIKWLQRYILQSKTYQLSSTPSAELLARDPANKWLGRFARRRLDAEALRDTMLSASGRLDPRRPGPHPFPHILEWKWTQHNPFKEIYASNHRSVYLMTQRIQRHPFLALFDGPDPNTSTEKRTDSLVPLQALFLMNHPFVREQAEGLAQRVLKLSPDVAMRVDWAHRLAWSRPATAEEKQAGAEYVKHFVDVAKRERAGEDVRRLKLEAWTSYSRVVLTANEFMFVD